MTTTRRRKINPPPPGSFIARFYNLKCWIKLLLSFMISPYRTYRELWKKPKTFREMPNRSGEVAVLTGGTGDIGVQVLRKLLQSRFHVILGCRSLIAGEDVVEKIRASGITTGSTKVFELDLKSLTSVRKFAANVLKKVPRIDVLVNNAGVMFPPFETTEEGYESQFQINYLSHFLLTNLLLDKIKETAKRSDKTRACRVVNVASEASHGGNLDLDDLENCKSYATIKSYCDSKLCLMLHAAYLDKLLRSEDVKVNVYSLHPGIIISNLWRHVDFITNFVLRFASHFSLKTTEDGASVVCYTALSPELEGVGGVYINTCEVANDCHFQVKDVNLQKRLWERSIKLCKDS